jgi:HAMP domain-containing protein
LAGGGAADRRQHTTVALGASLLGAIVTFLYFRYVDVGPGAPRPGPGELLFSGVAFAALGAIGLFLSNRWLRPLLRHRMDPTSPIDERLRQRALLLPYAIALVTFIGWAMAGIVWGILWPLMAGTFTVEKALRSLFGTSVIAGVLATAFVFLAIEHQWRRALPRFFPAGDLSTVAGVPRLRVRARLLGVFLLVGALPVSLLGLIAYTRTTAMRGASPDEAARLIHDLVFLVLFVAVVGLAMSVVLSLHVARSVAEPLREVERAMDGVAGGDLDARALVVSTDEIGAVAEGFNRMVQGLREREQIKETFGRYVSREIRDEILAGRVALGGQTLDVTILFSDLRDFTPWVEATPAADVVEALNSYFSEMEGRHPEPPRPGLAIHRRRDRGRIRRAGGHERPPDHGRARRPRYAPAPGRVERAAPRRRATHLPPRNRHPQRHRARRQYRQPGAARVLAGRRPREPRLAHPEPQQGLRLRHPRERDDAQAPRRRRRPGRLARGARQGQVRRGRGLAPALER